MLRMLFFFGMVLGVASCASGPARQGGDGAIPVESTDYSVSAPVPDTPAVDSTDLEPEPVRERLPVEALLGKVDPAHDSDFVLIASVYTAKSGIYMRREAYAAFQEMHAAAELDGVRLEIVSATRPFAHQKRIWERKWNGQTLVEGQNLARAVSDPVARAEKILRFSSMPGTSRHHWGTDIDLNNLNNVWFESGTGLKVYEWLQAHAGDYGFCQVYSPINEDRMHGYQEEKWHWSFLPLANDFLEDYRTLVDYGKLGGFAGEEAAEPLQVIDHYVAGINPECH